MPAFEDADAAFTAGPPLLQFLEPARPLFCFALFARRSAGRGWRLV